MTSGCNLDLVLLKIGLQINEIKASYITIHKGWAIGQTEPIGSVHRSFSKFGLQKPKTDRSFLKHRTETFQSRLVRFGVGHDRRLLQEPIKKKTCDSRIN